MNKYPISLPCNKQMDYAQFLSKLRAIKEMGYVPSHRAGDTGIGKTLEDLLGIEENNIAGPDFESYELKSARKGATSMLTLFTKVPEPVGANSLLLTHFGYPPRRKLVTRKAVQLRLAPGVSLPAQDLPPVRLTNELHVTVEYGRENSVGLKLSLESDKLIIDNQKAVPAYYSRLYLQQAFERKYGHRLVYVLADDRKTRSLPEEFWYNEAHLMSGFDFSGFLELVRDRTIKLDLRLGHHPDGRPHDHGTGFRVFPRDLPRCFSHVESIL